MTDSDRSPLTYRDAGVDIAAGDALVDAIKPIARSTTRAGCLDGLGGFGALFEVPPGRYDEPVLVSGTDGVGTKLRLAIDAGRHQTIGIDLVAMCANDILAQGAEPLFFMDYFACGRLDLDTARAVIAGIGDGCRQAGAALIGGETAEMPGMYAAADYDLAGFCVGVVEKRRIIDGRRVAAGDRLIALASSGPHSNGYSLIRRIIERERLDLDAPFDGGSLGEALLTPTRIYVGAVLPLLERVNVHAIAHITGGGLPGNVARVIPDGLRAVIRLDSWDPPPIFDWLQERGQVAEAEMYRTFNCGAGMVLAVAPEAAETALEQLTDRGERAWVIGEVETHAGGERVVLV